MARMNSPKARRVLLMLFPSFSWAPTAWVQCTDSEPAKSTYFEKLIISHAQNFEFHWKNIFWIIADQVKNCFTFQARLLIWNRQSKLDDTMGPRGELITHVWCCCAGSVGTKVRHFHAEIKLIIKFQYEVVFNRVLNGMQSTHTSVCVSKWL